MFLDALIQSTLDVVEFNSDLGVFKSYVISNGEKESDEQIFKTEKELIEYFGWHSDWDKSYDLHFYSEGNEYWGFVI